jgi:hypothetical protein
VSPLLIIVLIWLGLAVLVIAAGLTISRRRGPDRYLVMTIVELEESPGDELADYRKAA